MSELSACVIKLLYYNVSNLIPCCFVRVPSIRELSHLSDNSRETQKKKPSNKCHKHPSHYNAHLIDFKQVPLPSMEPL